MALRALTPEEWQQAQPAAPSTGRKLRPATTDDLAAVGVERYSLQREGDYLDNLTGQRRRPAYYEDAKLGRFNFDEQGGVTGADKAGAEFSYDGDTFKRMLEQRQIAPTPIFNDEVQAPADTPDLQRGAATPLVEDIGRTLKETIRRNLATEALTSVAAALTGVGPGGSNAERIDPYTGRLTDESDYVRRLRNDREGYDIESGDNPAWSGRDTPLFEGGPVVPGVAASGARMVGGLGAMFAGSAVDPINMAVPGSKAETMLARLGGNAVRFGGVNAAADAGGQALAVEGDRQEAYLPEQTLISGLVGTGLGGVVAALGPHVSTPSILDREAPEPAPAPPPGADDALHAMARENLRKQKITPRVEGYPEAFNVEVARLRGEQQPASAAAPPVDTIGAAIANLRAKDEARRAPAVDPTEAQLDAQVAAARPANAPDRLPPPTGLNSVENVGTAARDPSIPANDPRSRNPVGPAALRDEPSAEPNVLLHTRTVRERAPGGGVVEREVTSRVELAGQPTTIDGRVFVPVRDVDTGAVRNVEPGEIFPLTATPRAPGRPQGDGTPRTSLVPPRPAAPPAPPIMRTSLVKRVTPVSRETRGTPAAQTPNSVSRGTTVRMPDAAKPQMDGPDVPLGNAPRPAAQDLPPGQTRAIDPNVPLDDGRGPTPGLDAAKPVVAKRPTDEALDAARREGRLTDEEFANLEARERLDGDKMSPFFRKALETERARRAEKPSGGMREALETVRAKTPADAPGLRVADDGRVSDADGQPINFRSYSDVDQFVLDYKEKHGVALPERFRASTRDADGNMRLVDDDIAAKPTITNDPALDVDAPKQPKTVDDTISNPTLRRVTNADAAPKPGKEIVKVREGDKTLTANDAARTPSERRVPEDTVTPLKPLDDGLKPRAVETPEKPIDVEPNPDRRPRPKPARQPEDLTPVDGPEIKPVTSAMERMTELGRQIERKIQERSDLKDAIRRDGLPPGSPKWKERMAPVEALNKDIARLQHEAGEALDEATGNRPERPAIEGRGRGTSDEDLVRMGRLEERVEYMKRQNNPEAAARAQKELDELRAKVADAEAGRAAKPAAPKESAAMAARRVRYDEANAKKLDWAKSRQDLADKAKVDLADLKRRIKIVAKREAAGGEGQAAIREKLEAQVEPLKEKIDRLETEAASIRLKELNNKVSANAFLDPGAWKRALLDPSVRVIANYMRAHAKADPARAAFWREAVEAMQSEPKSPERKVAGVTVPARAIGASRVIANMHDTMVVSDVGALRGLARRYEDVVFSDDVAAEMSDPSLAGKNIIQWMADQIGSEPGSGRLVGRAYENEGAQDFKRFSRRIDNAMSEMEIGDGRTNVKERDRVLAELVTGQTPTGPVTGAMRVAAAKIRQAFDDEWTAGVDAGLFTTKGDIGRKSPPKDYLSRVFDEDAIMKDKDGFVENATRAYVDAGVDPDAAAAKAKVLLANIISPASRRIGRAFSETSSLPNPTKARQWKAGADAYMRPYYVNDIRHIAVGYGKSMAFARAYARRFGPKGEKLQAAFDEVTRAIPRDADRELVQMHMNLALGVHDFGRTPQAITGALSWLQAYGVTKFLARTATLQLLEPGMIAARENKGVVTTFKHLIDATKFYFDKSADARDAEQLADIIGLTGAAAKDMFLDARLTGIESNLARRFVGNVMDSFGITQLTERQRIYAMQVGQKVVRAALEDVAGDHKNAKSAASLLGEYGISAEQAPKVLKWLDEVEKLPAQDRAEVIAYAENANARAYRGILHDFAVKSILEPTAAETPAFAKHPLWRLAYSLSSFQHAFTREVLLRNSAQLKRVFTEKGLTAQDQLALAGSAGAVAAMGLAQVLMNVYVRQPLFSSQAAGERTDLENFMNNLSRAGGFGNYDTAVNTLSSFLRYERDPAGLSAGPYLGGSLNSVFDIVKGIPGAPGNSEGTKTAEWQAAKETYGSIVAPSILGVAAQIPMGPGASVARAAGSAYISSSDAQRSVATAIAGEKTDRRRGGGDADSERDFESGNSEE